MALSTEVETERQTNLMLRLGGGQREQLKLVNIDAVEALSEPFHFTLDVLALTELVLLDMLGKPAGVSSMLDGQALRHFHGLVIDARYIEEIENAGFLYRLTLAPSSHFHTQGSNFRIFQDKSVTDIVKTVLDKCLIEYQIKARGGKRKLAYCVQYGESDFAFVCRLLEEDGLYYFYQHAVDGHKLIICDNPASHAPLTAAKLTYDPGTRYHSLIDSKHRGAGPKHVYVHSWHEHASSGAEAKVTLRDFDFKEPGKPQEATASEKKAHDEDTIEVYTWPGRYYHHADGQALGAVVLESRRAQRLVYEVETNYAGIETGFTFALDRHPNHRFGAKYLIIRCHTKLASEQYTSGTDGSEHLVEFSAIRDNIPFRAPLITPRPTAKGPETAVVTGPSGEEIHVDEFGRIKVQFHWDRVGNNDDNSSCWIRVSQTGGLGNIIIPRVGHEVLVDFINGNPDRPIVVGRVFNASHKPVYTLPEHKTRALWRTKTYKQDHGSKLDGVEALDTEAPGANELRFEDAKGKEELFIHAERDMNSRVRYSQTHHVGKDVEIKVGKNRTETVGTDETITIKGNRKEKVEGTEDVSVEGDRKVEIKSNDTLKVSQKLKIDAGTEIEITAGTKITLTVQGSSIEIGPTSIKISTVQLEMAGSGTAKLTGALTNVEASGLLTAKGGMVFIN